MVILLEFVHQMDNGLGGMENAFVSNINTLTHHSCWSLTNHYPHLHFHNHIGIVALPCPKLKPPENGHFIPSSCSTGKSPPSHRCILACHKGYHVQGRAVLTCLNSQQWNRPVPSCGKGKIHSNCYSLNAFFILG